MRPIPSADYSIPAAEITRGGSPRVQTVNRRDAPDRPGCPGREVASDRSGEVRLLPPAPHVSFPLLNEHDTPTVPGDAPGHLNRDSR